MGDGFKQVSNNEDYEFWACVSAICNHPSVDPSKLSDIVDQDLECVDVSEIRARRLYLGETASIESPLALHLLAIRGILVVTDDDDTLLNIAEMTGLPTHPVSQQAKLETNLDEAVSFMRELKGACLVCSTSGNGRAAVLCAAAIAVQEKVCKMAHYSRPLRSLPLARVHAVSSTSAADLTADRPATGLLAGERRGRTLRGRQTSRPFNSLGVGRGGA